MPSPRNKNCIDPRRSYSITSLNIVLLVSSSRTLWPSSASDGTLKKQTNTSRSTVGCLTITVVTKFGIADLQRRPQPPCQSLAAKNRFCLRVLPAPPSSSPPLSSPPTHGRRASERASILICQPVACVLFNPRPKVIIATICRSQSRPCCYGPPERPLAPPSLGDFRLWALRLPSLPRCDRRWQSIGLLQFHKNRRKK